MLYRSPASWRPALIAAIILTIGVGYLLTIRPGHDWGDDYAQYIHHAKNLALGLDYNATGYIYNPAVSWVGPESYPPVFPLLLMPVYQWFGLNLEAMKAEIILCFGLFLALVYLSFRSELAFLLPLLRHSGNRAQIVFKNAAFEVDKISP